MPAVKVWKAGTAGKHGEVMKVIYFGLPGELSEDGENYLTGPAAWVPNWLAQMCAGEDGFCFMVYEGSYWKALWAWLKGD
jgi:hypothetical protein